MRSREASARLRTVGKIAGLTAAAGWLGALMLLLAGASCGKVGFFSDAATPTPTSSATSTPTIGLVFATNNADGTLSEFSRDLTSGALTLLGTTAVGAAPGPSGLALSPSLDFLYVANESDATIREFSVNLTNGALAGIGSVSDGSGAAPQQIAIDPSDSFLYVTNGTGASISPYTIATDGTLNANGTFTDAGVVVQPMGIAAAPGGGVIYVADFGSGQVLSLAIQAGGGLALINSVPSLGTSGPGQPRGIAVDPTGDFVYVADSGNGTNGVVSVFAVGTGNVLSYVASYSTAATTRTTFDLALADNAASGTLYLYATNGVINTVSDFVVSTGVLSLESSTGGLSGPEGIVSDPNGDFVYAANSATGQIVGYSVGTDGALSLIGAFNTENPANGASAPIFLAITD